MLIKLGQLTKTINNYTYITSILSVISAMVSIGASNSVTQQIIKLLFDEGTNAT